jgi:hypothetical protein
MRKFVALITGCGVGCDYTIACNKDFKVQQAEPEEELFNKLMEEYGHTENATDLPTIDSIIIFEVKDSGMVFLDLSERYDKNKKRVLEEKQDAIDKDLYYKLKQKFE